MFCSWPVRISPSSSIAEALEVLRLLTVADQEVDDREAAVGAEERRRTIDQHLARRHGAAGRRERRRSDRRHGRRRGDRDRVADVEVEIAEIDVDAAESPPGPSKPSGKLSSR